MSHSARFPIVLVAAAAATAPALGQAWTQQAPFPADADLLAAHFVSPDVGWIAGYDDLLMATEDGGVTWAQTTAVERDPLFSEDPIWAIEFVDANHGWAWGNRGFRTTDGGETWEEMPFVDSIYDVQFFDPQRGYLVSNLAVYRTDDGGESVTMVWDWQDFNLIRDASFVSGDEGLLAAEENDVRGVFRTTDAGQSWQRISHQALEQIRHVTADIVVGADQSRFYRSDDGGATWTLVLDDRIAGVANSSVEEIAVIAGDALAAIDINARIWISDDAGATWTRTRDAVGNWGFGWDIQFPTPAVGYAVGRLGLIYKTTDGGDTWAEISNGAVAGINDLAVRPNGTGIAVASVGTVVRTTDSGRHWRVAQVEDSRGISPDLNAIEMVDDDTFFVAGDHGAVWRSDDAGATWTLTAQLPYDQIADVAFLDENEGWAVGRIVAPFGFLAHTTDGGFTWTRLDDGDLYPPTEVRVRPSRRGWALIPQSVHVITQDGFDSYVGRGLPDGDSWQWFDYASDDVGWYGAFYGDVIKTTNGGFIFQRQTLPGFRRGGGGSDHRLRDVRVLGPQDAYIATLRPGANYQGVIYRTTDGESWFELAPISVPTNQFAGAIGPMDVLPSGDIWVSGGLGFIFTSAAPGVEGDVDGDGDVDFQDLLDLLAAWGPCPEPPAECPADLDGNGLVDFADLLRLLAAWS